MSKISIDTIREELQSYGWSLISDSYVNLDGELHFQCAEGHDVYSSWKKMRQQPTCPICKQNIYKNLDTSYVEKKSGTQRILALDQATHNTGWSVFDGKTLVKYGIFSTEKREEIERFTDVRQWLISMIENWKPDIIGIEGIQYQSQAGVTTFQTLARLQGILMQTVHECGLRYVISPTNTWRAHCKVKGRTRNDKKSSMKKLIKEWFDISVGDDIADAIGIGKYLADTEGKKFEVVQWV